MILTVHHLEASQSERIVFLCEELHLDYDLKRYKRSPIIAPPELARIHPTRSAPVIEDDYLTTPLAESGAIMMYLCQRYGDGKLILQPSDPSYPDFLYWFFWANCSLQPVLSIGMATLTTSGPKDSYINGLFNERRGWALQMLDDRVAEKTWVAGDHFTIADIMLTYTLTTFRTMYPLSLTDYPAIVAWLERICTREGYRRAMQKCDPDLGYTRGSEPPPRWNPEFKDDRI